MGVVNVVVRMAASAPRGDERDGVNCRRCRTPGLGPAGIVELYVLCRVTATGRAGVVVSGVLVRTVGDD